MLVEEEREEVSPEKLKSGKENEASQYGVLEYYDWPEKDITIRGEQRT